MKRVQKILVVDDDNFMTERLAMMLTILGIKDITKALDGVNALEQFEGALLGGVPYSLVLLDIVMPGMDGQEVLRRMRAVEKKAGIAGDDKSIIIMATGLNSPRDMMDALLEGDSTDYLVKPIEEASLKAMLTKYGFIGEL